MWVLIILFLPIALLLLIIDEKIRKQKSKNDYAKLKNSPQDLENEYIELNNLINNIQEENIVKDNYEELKRQDKQPIYYDDSVTEEEINKELNNIKDDNLSINEIVFLKFMNNKAIDYTFSPRWEFMYEIKPRIKVAKLLKQNYLTYSTWYDNIKNATIKELKEVLKKEELPISGRKQDLIERLLENIDTDLLEKTFNKGKYILTDKGNKIIEQNKKLFVEDREKAGKEFEELTNSEYTQLQVFGKVNEYKRLKHNELSFEKGYTKNDVLWSIYNKQILIYTKKKDYIMVGVVYDNMCDILEEQGRYEQEIHFLICCMFYRVYKMLPSDGIIGDVDYYKRHMEKYCKQIKRVMQKCNKDIEEVNIRHDFIINEIKRILEHYVPKPFLEFEKVNRFQQKVNQFLDT